MASCLKLARRALTITTPVRHILQPSCTQHLPSKVVPCLLHQRTLSTTSEEPYSGNTSIAAIQRKQWGAEEEADTNKVLLSNEYWHLPIIMIHSQWSDTAVSVHSHDKLEELDAVWVMFANDLGAYGMSNRIRAEVVEELTNKALAYMATKRWYKARVVQKGWAGQAQHAYKVMDSNKNFEFVSITDMSRRLGEEKPFYQRAVKAYPGKVRKTDMMEEGPDNVPTEVIDQFTRLNVFWRDLPAYGHNTPKFILRNRNKYAKEKDEKPATKRGFKKKKGGDGKTAGKTDHIPIRLNKL